MKIKTALSAIIALLAFVVVLPLQTIATYILYQHVHAPTVVWVLWLIQLPLVIFIQILGGIVKRIEE